jgi:lysophospholipase L1-like esterase
MDARIEGVHMLKGLFLFVLVLVGIPGVLPCYAYGSELPLLKGVKRILFLGDSITYAGEYVDYVQVYLETHCSDQSFEIIDMGLPSETVSGLTEPGHAGGAFPRPVLSERLDRVLSKVKPDLVFACYGMNDGIYYPFSEDRFAKYRAGIQSLVDRVTAAKAPIVLITPPPFDAIAIKGQTLPAGLKEYTKPFEGYDQVLGKYSDWLLQQRKHGWQVIDIHTPINQYLADQRKLNADFRLAGDGVHINAVGHWLIADQILTFLGAAAPAAPVVVDARNGRLRGVTGTIEAHVNYTTLTFHAPVPMPIDPALNLTEEQRKAVRDRYDQMLFRVRNERAATCTVTIAGTEPGTFNRAELADGVSLMPAIETLGKARSDKLLRMVHEVRAMLTDAWLTDVGHKRPGMAQGLPIDQAIETARKQESDIKALAAPLTLAVDIRPVVQ